MSPGNGACVLKQIILAVALVIFAGVGISNLTHSKQTIQLKDIQLKDASLRLRELSERYEHELQQKNVNQEELKRLQEEKAKLEQELQARAEAKRIAAEKLQQAARAASGTQTVSASAGCGDNFYANYIYMKESGCRLTATNSIGCVGIGQSCPGGSGLVAECPNWRTDYACQNAHFTRYAQNRYGGWEKAYQFWLANHWW